MSTETASRTPSRAALLVTTLLLLVAGLAAGLATAEADAPAGGTGVIRNRLTGSCVELTAAATYGGVVGASCSAAGAQRWAEGVSTRMPARPAPNSLLPYGNEHSLRNATGGGCLDSNVQGDVYVLPCEEGNWYQAWVRTSRFLRTGAGDREVVGYRNVATRLCLSDGEDGVRTAECDPYAQAQQFRRAAGTGGTGGTRLTVAVNDGAGRATTSTLTCDPAGGDHPDPAAACAALEVGGGTALPPVPPDQACTTVYGGPQTATVTGTWRGQPVSSVLDRTNGCEISRWTALAGLLPTAE